MICKLIMPNIAIGDFDSVSAQILDFYEKRGLRIEKYPPEKDFTDLELAVKLAVGLSPEEIIILGATGTRLDHTFAAMNTLVRAEREGIRAYIKDEHNIITMISKSITLKGKKGEKISLMPFTEKAASVSAKGLKYELKETDMYSGVSLGVSNEFIEETAEISVGDGYLFVIRSKD